MSESNGETLRRWLPALFVAFGLAVSWGSIQTQLSVMAEEVSELKEEDADHNTRERVDKAELAAVKATQQSIKEDVEEIKETQKEQDKKLDKILDELRQR